MHMHAFSYRYLYVHHFYTYTFWLDYVIPIYTYSDTLLYLSFPITFSGGHQVYFLFFLIGLGQGSIYIGKKKQVDTDESKIELYYY